MEILKNHWISSTYNGKEGLEHYIKYIKAKGPYTEYGHITHTQDDEESRPDKRKISEVICDEVKKGTRFSKLCGSYPGSINVINKLMRFHPPREGRTDVLYYWGPPGIGKTTAVLRVLQTIRKLYPDVDYYCKLGGLDRWWDGYDNNPIVYIDDPVANNLKSGDETNIQRLKNVLSTGDTLVEIKGGSMVFTSNLIIITSNLNPQFLANSCGHDNCEAIYRRLTDTCGAHHLNDRRDVMLKMIHHLVRIIQRNIDANLGINIDVAHVIKNIPDIKLPKYNDIDFNSCNTYTILKS